MDNFYDEEDDSAVMSTGGEYLISLSNGQTAVISDEAFGLGF